MPPGYNGIVHEFLTPERIHTHRSVTEGRTIRNVGPACGTPELEIPGSVCRRSPERRPVKISTFRPLLIRRARSVDHHH